MSESSESLGKRVMSESSESSVSSVPVRKRARTLRPHLPHLPHDIVSSGILTRLPVRSLFRFRCVSKSWKATIDDPNFVESHWQHNTCSTSSILGLYRTQKRKDPHKWVFSFATKDVPNFCTFSHPKTEDTKFVGHCNGLFCFVSKYCFIISNPCTHEYLLHYLPPPPPLYLPDRCYGFGFDSVTNEYKLVQIVHGRRSLYRCMVYTLGPQTDSWREIKLAQVNLSHYLMPQQYLGSTINSGRAIYINGTFFWFFRRAHLFMSFHLHAENFTFFGGPKPQNCFETFYRNNPSCRGVLLELQGCLFLAFQNHDGDVVHLYKINHPSAQGFTLKVLNLQHKSVLEVGALGAESSLYSLTAEDVIAYPLEGLDGQHHRLIGSKFAKLPLPLRLDLSSVSEYGFSYHVERLVSLKSLMGPSGVTYKKN